MTIPSNLNWNGCLCLWGLWSILVVFGVMAVRRRAKQAKRRQTPGKLWRTLVTVDYLTIECAFVKVPAGAVTESLQLGLDDLPAGIVNRMRNGQKFFHAKVNLGVEASYDLIFRDWEAG